MSEPVELGYLLETQTSKLNVYRHWRDWKTKQIIETISPKDQVTPDHWLAAFEAVVCFHHEAGQIVFCDPMSEVMKGGPRYHRCKVIRLDRFLKLAMKYGGENTHGPDAWLTWKPDLTLLDLLRENAEVRSKLDFTLFK